MNNKKIKLITIFVLFVMNLSNNITIYAHDGWDGFTPIIRVINPSITIDPTYGKVTFSAQGINTHHMALFINDVCVEVVTGEYQDQVFEFTPQYFYSNTTITYYFAARNVEDQESGIRIETPKFKLYFEPGVKQYLYSTFNDRRLYWGCNYCHYYLGDMIEDDYYYYLDNIEGAFSSWSQDRFNLDSPVYYEETNNFSGSNIDIYCTTDYSTLGNSYDTAGIVYFQDEYLNDLGVPPTQDYWAKIYINNSSNPLHNGLRNSRYDDAHKQGIIAHELGHAFGLSHVYNIDTLLYYKIPEDLNDMTVDVTASDLYGVVVLYQ